MNDNDPIFDKIDIDSPAFRRRLVWEKDTGPQDCEIQIWMPIQDEGQWRSVVRTVRLGRTITSTASGNDPLAALIGALAFARDAVDRKSERVMFGEHESGGLPVFLARGLSPAVLAHVEKEASKIADDAFTCRVTGSWETPLCFMTQVLS